MSKEIQWPQPTSWKSVGAGLLGAMLLAIMFIALTRGRPGGPVPSQSPSPSFTANVTPLPAECMVPGVIAAECIEGWSQEALAAIQCPHEDGRPDGRPCVWIDPDTRTLYYVDSSEYRR